MLQTLVWPVEIRPAILEVLESEVRLQQVKMAASLIESTAADFEPEKHEDYYQNQCRRCEGPGSNASNDDDETDNAD
ncbi:hypothetical protein [Dietzia sp. Die43]|uniref:hypothetical protein n=1 Tax=Dietzia sp. Die43 TaxID=2926011 RepID=UPI00211943E9|nr:hypothetical protein [Dietzia sp. Die43]